MNPELIIFAIEAAVRIGRKLNAVLIDETVERPLLLPLGDLLADIPAIDAQDFFDLPENRTLVQEGGPYFDATRHELLLAYATLRQLDQRMGGAGDLREASALVENLYAYEQLKAGFGANHPLQRILGTIVEIGVDYFSTHPEALGKESGSRKVIQAFVARLDDVEFAEGSREAVVGDLLLAALQTLDQNVTLVSDEKRLQVLLGGITQALIKDVETATSEAEKIRRGDLIKRIGSSVLLGGAGAFTENTHLFLPADSAAGPLVESTLRQVLEGLRGKEDIFTNESLELLFKGALCAVGENSAVFSDQGALQDLIASTVEVLASRQVAEIFSRETASALLAASLEVTCENIETLIDTDHPRKQLLASAAAALALGLSDELAGGSGPRDLLSRKQLVSMATSVFEEIARHPEQLIGDGLGDARATALAQIVGSVAQALGDDPSRLVNGEGFVELVKTALRVGIRNADKLIDLDTHDATTNLLFRITREIASAVLETPDPRKLMSRDVFLELAQRALPVVSANIGPLIAGREPIVQQTVARALDLAAGVLDDEINGDNIAALLEGMLAEVLRGELPLDQDEQIVEAAREILRAA
jgi:hypothetical protein